MRAGVDERRADGRVRLGLNDREEFGVECAFGALEVIAALAIARVQLLEELISEVVGGEREANVIQFPDRTPAA